MLARWLTTEQSANYRCGNNPDRMPHDRQEAEDEGQDQKEGDDLANGSDPRFAQKPPGDWMLIASLQRTEC